MYPVMYVPAGDVLPILFSTYAGATGASVTLTGLAVTDIEIYKDGGTTQRASDAGYVLLDTDGIDFDGITGIHGFSIDTGDNTDASFYTVGAWFTVVVSAVTVDSQTVNFIAAMFRIMPAESSAGVPKVDPSHFGGTAGTFSGGRPEVNASHAAGTAWNSGAIGAATLASDTIAAAKIATGAITAAKFAAGAIDAAAIADGAIDAGALAADAITAAKLAADVTTELQSGLATAANLATVAGYIDTEVAAILAAVDTEVAAIKAVTDLLPDAGALTSLATQASVNTIDDFLDTEITAIKAKTDQLTFTVANQVDSNAITIDEDEILDDALTDSVPADGALPTVRQALYMLTQFMFERSVSGTTVTVNKVDGTTALMTFTLNDGTSPTAITRAT